MFTHSLVKIYATILFLTLFRIEATIVKNVNFNPVKNVSRDTYLAESVDKLKKNGYVILAGFGGMGKSRMANSIAIKLQSSNFYGYKVIWWIDAKKNICEQLNTLIKEMNAKIGKVTIFTGAVDKEVLLQKIETFAEKERIKILIVFDSLESPQETQEIIDNVKRKNVHLIFTSRINSGYPSCVNISSFTREESISYLKIVLPAYSTEDLNKLAECLKDYPLSLSQSSHYIQRNKALSLEGYMQYYTDKLKILWSKEEEALSATQNESCSVRATVNLSLEAINQGCNLPKQILILFSLLNNQNVPDKLIYDVGMSLGWAKEDIQDALSLLINYNFITVENKAEGNAYLYGIHELIQSSILSESEEAEINNVAANLSDYMLSLILENKNRIITFSKEHNFFFIHLMRLLKTIKSNNQLIANYIKINIFYLDYLLYVKRNHKDALELIDEILPYIKTIEDVHLLARFYSSAGDVLSLHRPSDYSTNTIFGIMNDFLKNPKLTDSFEIVRLQNSITQSLLLKSLVESAQKYVSKSVVLIKKFKYAENKIPTLYFAAWVSLDSGRFEDSLEYLNESIDLFGNYPDSAIKFHTYNFKAFSLLRLKKYKEALEFSVLSLRKCRDYFGRFPSDTMAEALIYKAEATLHTGGSKSASPIVEEAINVYNAFYNNEYVVLDQAYASMIKGDCALLEEKYEDALAAYVTSLGVVDKIAASKNSPFFRRLIFRLIYASEKAAKHNISCRYIEVAKNCNVENFNLILLYSLSPHNVIKEF